MDPAHKLHSLYSIKLNKKKNIFDLLKILTFIFVCYLKCLTMMIIFCKNHNNVYVLLKTNIWLCYYEFGQ